MRTAIEDQLKSYDAEVLKNFFVHFGNGQSVISGGGPGHSPF
jgi:hypothetical protein